MTEIVMSQTTPPELQGPTDKERKYDRQLRLWGAKGQTSLENANILLLNSGAGTVGVETLKNLVLPGIGRFAIIDDATVAEADLGVNFFLDDTCLGKERSRCASELLVELNPEVQSSWHTTGDDETGNSVQAILDSSPVFTILMFTHPIRPSYEARLQEYSRLHKAPLVAVHSAGLYSYFRISLPGAFPIVETHPDETATSDLRLLSPWPELVDFAKELTRDIESLDNHEHGHLPSVVILLHYLDLWKETHDGAHPITYAEKTAFRKMVQDAARKDNPEGGEENFEEAVAAVLKTVVPPSLASGLREVFEYKHAHAVEQRSGFWIIADAVKQFFDKHGCLPLPGNVPDMKAQSSVYVRLQNIYKSKARRDAAEVLEMVRATPGGDEVDPSDVDVFCKNAAFIKIINATEGADDPGRLGKVVAQELANDKHAEELMTPLSLLPIYLALRATSHVESATEEEIMKHIMEEVPEAAQSERVIKCAKEVARANGGELHNISALTGGMVAQEMIKVITKQYIPIDNTCIFDGISSRCQVLRL